MQTDRERWDAKHAAARERALEAPDGFVVRALDRLATEGVRPGTALDLASGRGRHTLELARRGYRTTAWDVSPVALEALARHARAAGLAVATRAVDLRESARPGDQSFDLVLVVNFLDRDRFATLGELVRPGGHALVTTFTTERPGTRPPLAYCLEPGELARRFADRAVLAFEDGGRAGVLARF